MTDQKNKKNLKKLKEKKKHSEERLGSFSDLNDLDLIEEVDDDLDEDFTKGFEFKEHFMRKINTDDRKRLDDWRKKNKDKRKDSSTTEGVMDLTTSKIVLSLINKGYIKSLGGIISTGKEANVYYAESQNKDLTYNIPELAVKIYRTRTLDFKKIKSYIAGDRRFKQRSGNKAHQIIEQWALKEYKNLTRAFEAGVSVPKPILVKRNVLLMEYIKSPALGQEELFFSAPTLQELQNDPVFIEKKDVIYSQVLNEVSILWNKAQLVHGDLSEYNILGKKQSTENTDLKAYLIDISQAVLNNHNSAHQFLLRDLFNLTNFFSRISGKQNQKEYDYQKLYREITGENTSEKDITLFEGELER